MKKMHRLLAGLLILALALTGCARRRTDPFAALGFPAPDPDRGTVSYRQMLQEYSRPDVQAIEEEAGELARTANGMKLGEAFRALQRFEERLNGYYAAYNLTSVRHSIDRSDAAAREEYDFFLDTAQQVQNASDGLYTALAGGPHVSMLEKRYYGAGFFDSYRQDGEENARLAALLAQESRLVARYDELSLDQTVLFEGEERSWNELYADPRLYGARWDQACTAYYEKYGPLMGEIFVQLLQVRQEVARLSGYDSYAQYAFDGFGREYTPQQSQVYIQDVITWLLPLYQEAEEQGLWSDYDMSSPMSEEEVRGAASRALGEMDGSLGDIWQYMDKYGLSDLTGSPNKVAGAYETYLSQYEAPFLVANLEGTLEDLLTVTHEFGHFCDDYVNWGVTYNMDVAECYSQGLEYLVVEYLEGACTREQMEQLLGGKLLDTLDLYVWQGLYSEFENQIYAMDPAQLSVEEINQAYAQVCRRFGMEDDSGAGYYSAGWIDVPHFFEQPFYIISYPVANDIAMQLWALELEERGAGVSVYLDLLDRADPYAGLMDVVEETGLQSPFDSGRLEQVARSVGEALELEVVPDLAA